mgnify:CR=1 FL=1
MIGLAYVKNGEKVNLLSGPRPVRLLFPRYQINPGTDGNSNRFEDPLIGPGKIKALVYPKFGDMGDGVDVGWHYVDIWDGAMTIDASSISWTAYAMIFYYG